MQHVISERKVFNLSDVTRSIQKTLNERYTSAYWIKAELIKLNFYQQTGHCFPDLVEKNNGRVVAQIKANIWCDNFIAINANFRKVLKEPLRDGVKILFLAKVTFHPEYGLSLNILDIDPNFTLGDLQREREETLHKLKVEGILDKNKGLKIPLLPKRIAIISEQSSKGYADFLKVFEEAGHPHGFRLFHMLFPSLLQGDKAVGTLINQLRQIRKVQARFDVVVIVRGGGADLSLTCYDHYLLAREIALFPLPVITGIGHATNLTIAEMVAHQNAITPTRLAHLILEHFHTFQDSVQKAEEAVTGVSKRILADERLLIENSAKLFRSVTGNSIQKNRHQLKENAQLVRQGSKARFRDEHVMIAGSLENIDTFGKQALRSAQMQLERQSLILKKDVFSGLATHRQHTIQSSLNLQQYAKILMKEKKISIENIARDVSNLDPRNVLKRGYSITLFNGKALSKVEQIEEGDTITSVLFEGELESKIVLKKPKHE